MDIHNSIKNRLNTYIENSKIPNIIFYGLSGSGKRTLVKWFLDKIYTNEELKTYVLTVDCAKGKGIKFIREELKFFAKTNIHYSINNHLFKTIVLYNADKLTIDAQSALRRCIELFSHTTRFIIVVEDKFKLLNPIISRFCEIYIPYPIINNKETNLHNIKTITQDCIKSKETYLKNKLKKFVPTNQLELLNLGSKLYEKAYNIYDLINYIETNKCIENKKKLNILVIIDKFMNEIKSEKIMILFVLDVLYFRSVLDLENMMNI